MDNDIFELDFPLGRTHCGMPLGNGNMGVLIWGTGNTLCLTLNRADYWDHRQGEQVLGPHYRELVNAYDPYDVEPINGKFIREERPLDANGFYWHSTRLPVGRFEFCLNYQLKKISLEYPSGEVTIHTRGGVIKFIQSLTCNMLYINDPLKLVTDIKCRPAWEWVSEILKKAKYMPPEMISDANIRGWRQACPEDPGISVVCSDTSLGYAINMILDGEDKNGASFEKVKEESFLWWGNYWQSAPEINIPDDFLDKFYKFALYKFACSTHPRGYACSLQGPWLEEYQCAPWSCDYHFNVNIQEIYTLAFATGKFENMMPLFDMLESETFQKVMKENAKSLFGIDDGVLMTHAVDDRGMQCGGISVGSVLDFACGGWTAQLYWLYYKYTMDKEFLKNRAFPFISKVMRVFEETLEERNGQLSIPLSISAEYGCIFPVMKNGRMVHQNSGRDPSYQLACMHMLADALIEASEILDIEAHPAWLDIKKRLPKYTLTGEEKSERIAIWNGQDLDVCHRHHSHLACIYPFDSLGVISTKEGKIIDNSIDHWILKGMGQWSEWCYPWAAIIQARLGFNEAPALLLNIWKEIFVNEGWSSVYLPKFRGLTAHRSSDMKKPKETTEIMQLDGTMGAATAILEMLVHTHSGITKIFPAVPDKWKDISFKNIRVPGGFLISASRKDGKLEEIKIESLHGGKITLDTGKNSEFEMTIRNCSLKVKFPTVLEISKGDSAIFRSAESAPCLFSE